MPYKITKFGEREYKVCNGDKPGKCYSKKYFTSKAQARRQQKALYANAKKT